MIDFEVQGFGLQVEQRGQSMDEMTEALNMKMDGVASRRRSHETGNLGDGVEEASHWVG